MQTLLKSFLITKSKVIKRIIQLRWINTSAHANKIVHLSHCKRSKIQRSIKNWMLLTSKMLDLWVWNNSLTVRNKKKRKPYSRYGVLEDMAVTLQARCPTPTYFKCMFNGIQWLTRALQFTLKCKACHQIIYWVNRRSCKALLTGIIRMSTFRSKISMSCAKSSTKHIQNDLHFIIVEKTYIRVD